MLTVNCTGTIPELPSLLVIAAQDNKLVLLVWTILVCATGICNWSRTQCILKIKLLTQSEHKSTFYFVSREKGMRAQQLTQRRQRKMPRCSTMRESRRKSFHIFCTRLSLCCLFYPCRLCLSRLCTMLGRRGGAQMNLNLLKSSAKEAYLNWDRVGHAQSVTCLLQTKVDLE